MATSTPSSGISSHRTSLQDLPTELLITIANLLSDHDLRNLRQVSRLVEGTTYKKWRKSCCTFITIDTATEDLDWHLELFSTSRSIRRDITLIRLVLPEVVTASNMAATMKCLSRLPDLLSLLPQVNSLRLRNLGARFDGNHWVSPATRPVPGMAEICQLFCRHEMKCMHLKNSHFSASELRILLSTLSPKRLFIDKCAMFSTISAFPSTEDSLKVTVASPATRHDVGHSYLGRWPMPGRFTGATYVQSSTGSYDYTVYGTNQRRQYVQCRFLYRIDSVRDTWFVRSGEEPSCACVHRLD